MAITAVICSSYGGKYSRKVLRDNQVQLISATTDMHSTMLARHSANNLLTTALAATWFEHEKKLRIGAAMLEWQLPEVYLASSSEKLTANGHLSHETVDSRAQSYLHDTKAWLEGGAQVRPDCWPGVLCCVRVRNGSLSRRVKMTRHVACLATQPRSRSLLHLPHRY